MASNSASTRSLQSIVDRVQNFAELSPVLNVAQSASEPALTIATDVMNAICGTSFPHKWNEIILPQFYTNSWQQDYVLLTSAGASVTNLSWLQRGIVIDINNTSMPKPFRYVECGRQLPQSTGSLWNSATNSPLFLVNYFPNNSLYYGTWGAGQNGNGTFGNNPGPGSVYTNPVGATVTAATWSSGSGGRATFTLTYLPNGLQAGSSLVVNGVFPIAYNGSWTVVSTSDVTPTAPTVTVTMTSNPGTYLAGGIIGNPANLNQPNNPITQIQDANGNLLVLTTYGTEGTAAPTLAANSTPGTTVSGTGATTVWTVADPYGQGIRITPVPCQTGVVWQFNLVAQAIPVQFTSLGQFLTPLPDMFEPNFRAGFIAQCYRYSPEAKIRAKFKDEWALWLASLTELRAKQDRELEENMFTVSRGVMSGNTGRSGGWGGAWPFNGPPPGQSF